MVKEKANFIVSSALKSLIGKELITNDYVAVFELVKNSFDAGANNIRILFDLQQQVIVIRDDGRGMSTDDVKNKWLFIGYSEKKEGGDITYSGNKGIGRFSCDRLGSLLKLETIKDGIKTSFTINWERFESNQSEKIETQSIELISDTSTEHAGTLIAISSLRKNWVENDVNKTKDQLLKLLSPFVDDNKQKIELVFINQLGIEEKTELHNDVFDYMKEKVVFVSTFFSEREIVTELFDHGKKIIKNVSRNNTLVKDAYISLFFADTSAKSIFKKKTGLNLVDYGNLFVYKNNFRIYPFGDRGYDAFGLSQRKSQGLYRYLGPREIIGWISIIDKSNNFVEATSRDRGFLLNEYSRSLEESYMEFAHKPLEKYVELLRYGNISIDDYLSTDNADVVVKEISHTFTLKDSIDVSLNNELIKSNKTDEMLRMLNDETLTKRDRERIIKKTVEQLKQRKREASNAAEKNKKQEEEIKNLKNEIKLKNQFIDIENPSRQDVLEHDLGLVSRRLKATVSNLFDVNRALKNERIDVAIQSISKNIYRINGIRNFILKTKMKTNIKKEIQVGTFFKEYSEISEFENVKISVVVEKEFVLKINVFDLITIFDNFLSNVNNLNGKKMDVYVNTTTIKFISDTFDSGKNIDFNRVFDYGYTTTTGGTGIGMFIVKQICKENGLTVSMKNIKNTNLVSMEINKNAQRD